jgi:RDD family
MAAADRSAPDAPAVVPSLPPGLVFADAYSRFAAYFLDGLLISTLISVPTALLGLYDYASVYPPEPMPRATFIGTTIFGIAAQAAYFLWFWTGGRRATPGQRAFNIQLGNAFDGQPLTMSQAIARWFAMGWWVSLVILLPFFALAVVAYAAGVVWWLILGISIINSPTKQGIHDRIARSALVRPAGPTSRWAIGCVWLYVASVIVLIVMALLFYLLLEGFRDSGLYPPGLDPFDIFTAQIREFWPS